MAFALQSWALPLQGEPATTWRLQCESHAVHRAIPCKVKFPQCAQDSLQRQAMVLCSPHPSELLSFVRHGHASNPSPSESLCLLCTTTFHAAVEDCHSPVQPDMSSLAGWNQESRAAQTWSAHPLTQEPQETPGPLCTPDRGRMAACGLQR